VRSGGCATFTLDEFPGVTFRGTIVRNGNSLEIVLGLQPTDGVIAVPSDSLVDGTMACVSSNSTGGSAE
jgi:hypothetical protein